MKGNSDVMRKLSSILKCSGLILVLIIGLVHLIDAKDSFNDAVYKGWLFYANGIVAVISAIGIYRNQNGGWFLGLLIALGSLGGYVASRTIGLPFIPPEPEAWFEPLGVIAVGAEILFVSVFISKRLNNP